MKVLESAPHRYDKGIKILTLGRIDKAYDRLVENIKEEDKVLDIGCGTGMLTFRAVLKGAKVTGMDISAEMLEIAKKRMKQLEVQSNVEFIEMGVAELDTFEKESFDIILSGLCFSELSEDEITFTLNQAQRILRKDGKLMIADEIKSKSIIKQIFNLILRIPLVIITYLLTQTTSKALKNFDEQISESSLTIQSYNSNFLENFAEFIIVKEDKE